MLECIVSVNNVGMSYDHPQYFLEDPEGEKVSNIVSGCDK